VTVGSVLAAIGMVVFGYLMGSLSPSVWLGKAVKGIDLREHGSGNAGTTNAFLVCDILKGVIPVVLSRYFSDPSVTVVVAIAAVFGHTFSIFLKGRGGKGVATGAGAAFAMIPVPMACLMVLFLLLLLTIRIVSVASMTSTIALPVGAGLLYHYDCAGVWFTPMAYVVACCLMAAVVLWGHRTNVGRLLHGTEHRVIFPWNKRARDKAEAARAASGGQSV
jgi:glycerol-3-phosphate acyltransferase PlsY